MNIPGICKARKPPYDITAVLVRKLRNYQKQAYQILIVTFVLLHSRRVYHKRNMSRGNSLSDELET